MTTATTPTLSQLFERLSELPEADQRFYAFMFLEQIDADIAFDQLIESRPDVLKEMSEQARIEYEQGLTQPLTEADFALEDE